MDLKRLSMLVGVVLSVAAQGRLAAAGRWPREASVGLVAVVPAESNYPKLSSWRCTRQSPCEHDPEREREVFRGQLPFPGFLTDHWLI